jgi:uncharacterized membrane protein YeaQ/YmgE (transglycosylase-associated protein family)
MEHLEAVRINHVAGCACSGTTHQVQCGVELMNILIWLVIGGVIGWLASLVMRTDGQQGILLNIVVGVVGALLGGWLISPLVGAGTINQGDLSLAGLGVSFLGAVILLAIVNVFRRGRVR